MNLKVIINCGPCEDYIGLCLASVRNQTFTRWDAFVTIDPSGDKTAERAFVERDGDDRIHIRVNSARLYSMANLVAAIRRSDAAPDDVIVILDGDDWFATDQALARIVAEYQASDCWMTYGTWIANDPTRAGLKAGRWPAYPEGTTRFREVEWLGTAVRSWKKWLWDKVDDREFRDRDGHYILVAEDQASMLPMLEMSGTDRARHIPDVLMVYNRITPHACGKVHLELMRNTAAYLRERTPYRPL
jgi:glycosyltransferase involved in cell wall biosynthesis